LCCNCHRDVHLNSHDFSLFLPDELLKPFRDYHESMFVDGVYSGYDIDGLPRMKEGSIINGKKLHYVQIDVDSFQDDGYYPLVSRFGFRFVGVHVECLKLMCRQPVTELCSILVNDKFISNMANKAGEDFAIVREIIQAMIDEGLLLRYLETDRYFSNGFMDRVGKMLLVNEERSRKQKENQRKKMLEKVDNG